MIEQYLTLDYPHVGYFFDERRNILVGDFIYEQDSLRIGVTDYNVNGQFNDFGADRIVIGKYGGAIKGVDEASGAIILDSSSFLHSTNYSFEIIKVAGNGTSISIKPTTKRKSNNLMEIGKPISDYSFHLISGEKTSLHSFLNGQNYLYLNFWATWCAGCHQEITDLENLYRNYPNKVKIVSLNYEQDLKKVNPFIEKYKILWDNGFSTSEINDKLFIDGLPRNILIDPSGKIVAMNMHPSKLLELVDDL
jgi:thiol-disulfide isomerase/thioredoxin